ncbi:MAG: PBSX family phage terminase large subunit [Ruminiclostridium sp.]|nr:PBSX family phage terminase large subunit [Ruminiclostridium sp.]
MTSNVRLTDIIAPSFYDVHRDIMDEKYTHHWFPGGRGSCKSSFISTEIILGIMRNPGTNAVAVRRYGNTLLDSVYEQLQWAIDKLQVADRWKAMKSPLCLVYETGQKILFRGADDPKKLKSTKVSKGYIRYIWYEELDEFDGMPEVRSMNQSLMRGGSKFDAFYSYNPPKTQRAWVNIAALDTDVRKQVHRSDYRSVPPEWLGEEFIAEAEHLKETNPLAYEHEYLGEITGTGSEVFPNVTIRKITDEEIQSFDRVRRGLDWGYGADPFAYVALQYQKNIKTIYIYDEFYKCGAKYDTITEEIKKENTENRLIRAESAEPRSNDELRSRGLRIQAVKKGKGSVEHGISWLQNLREIVIDGDRCPNVAREFLGYALEPDGKGGFRDGFPDKDNHTIDAVRYALEDDMEQRKIKVHSKAKLGVM